MALRILFLLLGLSNIAIAQDSKGVYTSLNSNWKSTSLLAEASEFIAREDNELFFKFLDIVNEEIAQTEWNKLTEEKKYDLTIVLASKLLPSSSLDLLKFALALRQYSPVVQSFQQIASENLPPDCDSFFVINGRAGCDDSNIPKLLESSSGAAGNLSIDHIIGDESKKLVILYGELGSSEFAKLYSKLRRLVDEKKFKLAVRHFSKNVSDKYVSLSGYGVELAIKNTEYKAVDESNEKKSEANQDEENLYGYNIKLLKELHPEVKEQLDAFRAHLKDTDELTPLKKWELQDLSFQAAQKIMNVNPSDALNTLEQISQNFPLHARSLARTQVSNQLRNEIAVNLKSLEDLNIDSGENAFYINGISQDINSLDLFKLSDLLKQEEKLSSGFHNMGINKEYLSILVDTDTSDDEKVNYAIDYREGYPFFLNNLDTDKKYKQWSNSVKLMLQPYYPGMLRPIARNLFTLVFVVDPATKEGRKLMRTGANFYNHDIAMRIGYIFAVNDDPNVSGDDDIGVAILNMFNYIALETSIPEAMQTVNAFLDNYRTENPEIEDIKKFFSRKYPEMSLEEVFGKDSDFDKGRKPGIDFVRKSGLNGTPKVMLNGYVLDDEGVLSGNIEETIMYEVMKITQKIQKAIIEGKLTDRANVAKWMMEQKDVMPRINKRILTAPSTHSYIDLSGSKPCNGLTIVDQLRNLVSVDKARCLLESTKYLQKGSNDQILPITLWVSADADTVDGRRFLYNSLQLIKSSSKARIGLVLNPTNIEESCKPNSVSSYIHAALQLLPADQAKKLIAKLVNEEFAADFAAGKLKIDDISVGGMDVDAFAAGKAKLSCDSLRLSAELAQNVINVKPGQRIVVGNTLRVGPLDDNEHFEPSDFKLFENMLLSRGAESISKHLIKWKFDANNAAGSNNALLIAGHIGKYASSQTRSWVPLKQSQFSVVTLDADDHGRSSIQIVAIVDPLSAEAQKLSSILKLIKKVTNSEIRIVMNPKEKLSELPLKRFYRFAASSELTFDQNGNMNDVIVKFDKLPSKQLLTLSVQAPDSWIVEAVFAEYDLDNLKMEQVSKNVVAVYSLQHILLEGQCFDESTGQPPRGLQFVLGTEKNPLQFDTIVMANLGYFQLKANPGAWNLQIREGRSKEIYQVYSQVGADKIDENVLRVVIESFTGKAIRVRVQKREGMEDRSLLSDDEEGVWNSLSSKEKPEVINVFSLASGHLYERFMRIMFVSVMKNTKHPVKFWLLKNYLSPQFKKTLPILAEHYGFQYELVEYKWPRWLHQQKEKQRIMWGYKILFLDVLFPLEVQKIIFVDADQVVRADLMELMEYDLGNAPYGYVPFCESRKEMDGFRFWKQGYWANHLAGRRYHISALYVIDLQKFRQIAAGDRLRGQYQGLSSDPNSLANLDQDLPNNMIHQVKIKSLPQEWLWCETWCDDDSKKRAKTIDLCNNPLTKEPKLDSAVRIIGEWKEYDEEIKKVISGEAVTSQESEADTHSEL
ncbi:unnamed protein product [Caenorhabditis bovis]|uniref:UDP-glucose:glycoprotein glucosyltransferase n=1 Tax=Caenorhabditis bovis TaxID=2654633 RepID=A0A8S1EPM7_9PELO|nr:unnamed protein product [Caenorhabditis bovis]